MFARGLTNISMTSRLDRVLASEKLGCIVVFPDVMSTLVGTQYLNFSFHWELWNVYNGRDLTICSTEI